MSRFPSKVDFWFYLLFPVIFCTVALVAVEPWREGEMAGVYGAIVVGALVLGFQYWLLNTRYIVSADELLVVSGPIRWQIALADIDAVLPTRSVLSSPALSLDRLEISYSGGRKLLVSPKDKAGFLLALGFPSSQADP